ncbi:MAG: hypothetical protein WKG07_00085 [Hymenobacter sp.]
MLMRDALAAGAAGPAVDAEPARGGGRATDAGGRRRGSRLPPGGWDVLTPRWWQLGRGWSGRWRRDRGGDVGAVRPHRPDRPVLAGVGGGRDRPGGLRAGDPEPAGRGWRRSLRAAGVGRGRRHAALMRRAALNQAWSFAVDPWSSLRVVWKFAATLDGRSPAADGSSQWITSAAARGPTCTGLRRRGRRDPGRHRDGAGRRPSADGPPPGRHLRTTGSRCVW